MCTTTPGSNTRPAPCQCATHRLQASARLSGELEAIQRHLARPCHALVCLRVAPPVVARLHMQHRHCSVHAAEARELRRVRREEREAARG